MEAGGYAGDGEQEEVAGASYGCLVEGVVGAEGAEGTQLQVGQRVDVRVAELDGAAEDAAAFEQAGSAEDAEHPLLGEGVLFEDERGQVRAVAELEVPGEDAAVGLGQRHLRVLEHDLEQRDRKSVV